MSRRYVSPLSIFFFLFLLTVQQGPAAAAEIPVACSDANLVQAIVQANAGPGPMTLELPAGCVFRLQTIHNTDPAGDNGLPQITGDVTINGHGAVIQRDANVPEFRFFQVNAGASLRLNHLTLLRGLLVDSANGKKIDGGALYVNGGTAAVTDVLFDGNKAGCGGGVYVGSGTFRAERTAFKGNNGDS